MAKIEQTYHYVTENTRMLEFKLQMDQQEYVDFLSGRVKFEIESSPKRNLPDIKTVEVRR